MKKIINAILLSIGYFLVGMYYAALPAGVIICLSTLAGEPTFWPWPVFGIMIGFILWLSNPEGD